MLFMSSMVLSGASVTERALTNRVDSFLSGSKVFWRWLAELVNATRLLVTLAMAALLLAMMSSRLGICMAVLEGL